MSINFTINTSMLTKKNHDIEKVKDEEKKGCDYKQFEITDNRAQEPKSIKKEETETKKNLSRKDFETLIKDVADNLNNNKFKTTVEEKGYDLKNAKKFLVKITPAKISEKEALELHSDFIIPEIAALEKSKGKAKDKRNNILHVLKKLESVFTGVYLNYSDKPSESDESIAEITKLKRQRSDEIAQKKN